MPKDTDVTGYKKMGSLAQAFADCQRSMSSHPRILKQLVALHNKSDLDTFVANFTNLLKRSLIHGDKQPAVERTLNFVAKFATMRKDVSGNKENAERDEDEEEEDETDMFLVRLIEFLLNIHEANSQAVRFRVCQLINKILNNMGEEAVIDDELFSSIYDTMLQRLQDKVASVRVQAVLALARLQDPRNKDCPVLKAYRYHLSMDPNHDVRRAVLSGIAISFQTLPDVLERTRDVNNVVRREAFKVLAQKVHIRSLSIAQRVRLISEGLKDRCESVRKAVEKGLIQSWLRMVNSSVLDLLSCLDVEASVAEAELVLTTLFRENSFADMAENFGLDADKRIIEYGQLRPESALYWRCFAQHLRNEGAEEALETIIPDLSKFSNYVHEYAIMDPKDTGDEQEMAVLCMEREFVMTQLIKMTMLYDLSDEVGRRSLDNLVRSLLISNKIEEALIKELVEVFSKLHPPTSRVTQLAEIISEIREPATKTVVMVPVSDDEQRKKKMQAAKIKVRMNQIREEIEESARGLDFSKAQLLKEELEELEIDLSLINLDEMTTEEVPAQEERTDPTTLSKCLMIVCHMFGNPDISTMTPTLYSLNENLILPCLRSEDPVVRNQGVKALGLLCLVSSDLAKQHLVLFLQISRIDVEQIQLTALHCLLDLLLLYGLDNFTEAAEDLNELNDATVVGEAKEAEEEKEEGEGGVIIEALCQMMESENVEVRTHAAEGLCKLLLASRITSSKLLSQLILVWYNPETEDDSLLRHMLGVFFPLYASFGGANQESLCSAVLPTLQTLFNASSRSPLADVDVNDVANFLISITNPTFASEDASEQVNTHDTLVFTLCTEILANPNGSWTKVLIRCLNHLNLTPANYSTLRQIKVLSEKMLKKVRDRVCLNGLERFHAAILGFLKDAPEPVPEEEEEKEEDNNDTLVDNRSMAENTMIRKKRMLYNQTHSDLELFSSEAESDAEGSPSKCQATEVTRAEQHGDDSDEEIVLPERTSTQKDDEGAANSILPEEFHAAASDGDAELELSPIVSGHQKGKHNQKRTKKQRSSQSGGSSDEEVKTPSKVPRTVRQVGRPRRGAAAGAKPVGRRTKKESAAAEDSSEGEKAVPSKIRRRDGPRDDLQDDDTDSSESEMSTPSDVTNNEGKVEDKPGSSESLSESPHPKATRTRRSDSQSELNSQTDLTDSETAASQRSSVSSSSSASSRKSKIQSDSNAKRVSVVSETPESQRSTRSSSSSSSVKKSALVVSETPESQRSTRSSSSSNSLRKSALVVSETPESQRSSRSSSSSNSVGKTPSNARSSRKLATAVATTPDSESSVARRSTRNSGTSTSKSSSVYKSVGETPSNSSVTGEEPSPVVKRSARNARRGLASSHSSVSSYSSPSQTSSISATPFRRSGRLQASSQSTDSESDTPGKPATSRSSRSKRNSRK
ncbi:condensin complex subunit 3 [Palaemon carinicauda]|uniref:condensin complex subunit 3 n=1 Tax=Palaemon carinicauda TaxID=392227 RepID=UPI0035B5F36D